MAAGHSLELSRSIAASPERVWEVITDLDSAERRIASITKLERLSGEGYQVGTRWRETRRMFGKEETEEMRVTVADEPRRTVILAGGRGVSYETVFTLNPAGASTVLTMRFSAHTEDPNLFQKLTWLLFGPLGLIFTRRALGTDLDQIAAACTSPETLP